MNIKKLTKNIIECIRQLDDKQIIEIDAGRAGAAVFKETGEVLVSSSFTDAGKYDSAIRSYWENLYGPWHLVNLYGYGEENVYEMACIDYTSDDWETELDKKLADAAWVSSYASTSRGAMIANATQSAEEMIDFCNEHDM